jgi:anti-sigma regulatory factor (Ser/Thr protein kinase)
MIGVLLDREFVRSEIGVVRHQVDARAAGVGLNGHRRDGFVLAVNEIITNVVLHAGGIGRIRLAVAERAVRCQVLDTGGGIPDRHLAADLPGTFSVGGRGIWLAYLLCDSVTIDTGPEGTTVVLSSRLPDREVATELGRHAPDPDANRQDELRAALDG